MIPQGSQIIMTLILHCLQMYFMCYNIELMQFWKFKTTVILNFAVESNLKTGWVNVWICSMSMNWLLSYSLSLCWMCQRNVTALILKFSSVLQAIKTWQNCCYIIKQWPTMQQISHSYNFEDYLTCQRAWES